MKEKMKRLNREIFSRLSVYMNLNSDFITAEMVENLAKECELDTLDAYNYLLAGAIYIDADKREEDRELFELYFPHMVHYVDECVYREDPYYKNIRLPNVKKDNWEMKTAVIKPFELIPLDDPLTLDDGRVIPQLAFFDTEFSYPVVLENGVEWMLVTPNEVETMKQDIKKAHGKVLTYGLGLGYFVYLTSLMPEVESVTVVDISETAIDLFKEYILPQFENAHKVRIIHDDAFHYAEFVAPNENYDYIYADTWHDVSDGVGMYEKFKSLEKFTPTAEHTYWIEKTMKCYIDKKL